MDLASHRNIVVLTGAGISTSAGLPTYRGPGGLWSDPRLAELTTAEALATRRDEVTDMCWSLRTACARVTPSPAHRALAAFEERLAPGAKLTVITQNVDGLHQAAGSRSVVEYHGSLARWRCERCMREDTPPTDAPAPPTCCGERMRPGAVLFGEMIPVDAEVAAKRALRDPDLFVAIGTSGTVAPASSFVSWARLAGARTVLLNLELFDGARELFDDCRAGPADELVPAFFA